MKQSNNYHGIDAVDNMRRMTRKLLAGKTITIGRPDKAVLRSIWDAMNKTGVLLLPSVKEFHQRKLKRPFGPVIETELTITYSWIDIKTGAKTEPTPVRVTHCGEPGKITSSLTGALDKAEWLFFLLDLDLL